MLPFFTCVPPEYWLGWGGGGGVGAKTNSRDRNTSGNRKGE